VFVEAGAGADQDEVSLDVPAGDARSARHFITVVLVRWQLTSASKLIVMVGHELVANALRHGTPPARLLLRRRTDGVRIEVGDASSDVPLMPEIDNTTSTSGRGLRIVTSLARDWGVRVTKGGKVVWADIAVTTAAADIAVARDI
jgi:two-component sensor histidine kinase